MPADLFPQLPSPAPAHAGVCEVAMEQAVDRTLDYLIPSSLAERLRVCQRVLVPLGRGDHPSPGYVVAIKATSDFPRLKSLLSIDDPRELLTPRLLELARWMARYHHTPLGTIMATMLPMAVRKLTGVRQVSFVRPADHATLDAALAIVRHPVRKRVLTALRSLTPGSLPSLADLADSLEVTPATIRSLVSLGLVTLEQRTDFNLPDLLSESGALVPAPTPTPEQARVLAELLPNLSGFSVHLLYGVTGSGKTEVYLRGIEQVVSLGRQAIVLVPEISLTAQTVARFRQRFARVAVLHSGLTQSQRQSQWHAILTGQADVVIGARSALFAPLPSPGLIVIDEEHESSYKQDGAPRYHARETAIKRAQLEGIPLLLGSATPSIEMFWRSGGSAALAQALKGHSHHASPYHLHALPSRVPGAKLPDVEVVDLLREVGERKGTHLLSRRLEALLGETLKQGKQAILLLNRRGYASFLMCPHCRAVSKCRFCDVALSCHRPEDADPAAGASAPGSFAECHYCQSRSPIPTQCDVCGGKVVLLGIGTQRVEQELVRKFPGIVHARVDSDAIRSGREYSQILGDFAAGKTQVLVGTQIIAKGLDYPGVSLVGVIHADLALSLPDFRASERTFQLIVQVSGRSGRGKTPGRVVVQSYQPSETVIQLAVKGDYPAFAARELAARASAQLPPVWRLARIVLRDMDQEKVNHRAAAVAGKLTPIAEAHQVRVDGPMPCAIARVAGMHRVQIQLRHRDPLTLQKVLAQLQQEARLTDGDHAAIDVDPVILS